MLPHNLTICTYLYHSQKLRDAEADEQQHLLTTPKQLAAIFRCREQISVRTSGRSPNLTKPGMTPDRHVRLPFRPWSSDRRHNCHRCGNQTTSSHHSSRRGQRTLRLISNRTRLTSKRVNLVTVNDPLPLARHIWPAWPCDLHTGDAGSHAGCLRHGKARFARSLIKSQDKKGSSQSSQRSQRPVWAVPLKLSAHRDHATTPC